MKVVSFYKVSSDIVEILSSELESIGFKVVDFNTSEDSIIIENSIPESNKNIIKASKNWKTIEGLITIILEEMIEGNIVKYYFPIIKEEIDKSTYLEMLNRVVIKNNDKNNHGERVAMYGKEFSNFLGLPSEEIQKIYTTFLLHDIGKLGIPVNVLKKSSPLSKLEIDIVKLHVLISALFFPEKQFKEFRDIIIEHHERMDGSGYPFGLKETENSYYARMLSIIDSYDAMTTRRVYKRTFTQEEALETLRKGTISKKDGGVGNLYDKDLTESFIKFIKQRE